MSIAVNLTPDQSEKIIYTQLLSAGIPSALAVLVTAQSGHESAGWTSHVYKIDNNAFGYGYDGSKYKYYDSVEESAGDLAKYLNRRVADGSFPPLDQITDPGQYATLLRSAGYYTDNESNYQAGIMKYLDNALSMIAANPIPSGIIATIVIFGLALYFSNSKKSRTF